MKYPLWLYWQFYLLLLLAVYAACRAINSRFLVRRAIFGFIALTFDAFASWIVMKSWWPEPGCLYIEPWQGSLMGLPFGLIGLLFTWRFAVWHQKAISN